MDYKNDVRDWDSLLGAGLLSESRCQDKVLGVGIPYWPTMKKEV